MENRHLIGLGSAKSGTSWLYRQLQGHPSFHTKSIKELHYFDKGRKAGSYFDRSLQRRQVQLALERNESNPVLSRRKVAEIEKYLELYRNPYVDFSGYSSFLSSGSNKGQVLVDITPSYCELSPDCLLEIANKLGSVQFVYLMRDPVDRAWSHIRMKARRISTDPEDFKRNCRRILEAVVDGTQRDIVSRGNYMGMIEKLKVCGLRSDALVWAIDGDLGRNFLQVLSNHFNVEFGFSARKLEEKVHVGAACKLDARWRRGLQNALKEQIRVYHQCCEAQRRGVLS